MNLSAPDLDHTRFLVKIIHRLKGATVAQAERSELTIERETLRELQQHTYIQDRTLGRDDSET